MDNIFRKNEDVLCRIKKKITFVNKNKKQPYY